MIEFRSGGRKVTSRQFFANLQKKGIDLAFQHLENRVHGAAASIVDPVTGRHADVFVRRRGDEAVVIRTSGSPTFARELEKRLGVERGSIKSMTKKPVTPSVYLAHGSEDHEALAKPLAERMLADGIEVWLDRWEIRSGDSLRRKMEEGLGGCTHFVVLLTPNSLGKPWVETEIDAAFVRAVEGQCKFIALRIGVSINELSPFLRARRCPEVHLSNETEISEIIADIHGVSRKPSRGTAPRYVKSVPDGLSGWSSGAIAVAEYLVRASKFGCRFDPQTTIAEVAQATGLPEEDVRLGVLDLADGALVERSKEAGSKRFWPLIGLFVEFDRHFMDFDNQRDAVAVANQIVNEAVRKIEVEKLSQRFPDWTPRRLNSALNYLEEAKAIDPMRVLSQGHWTMKRLAMTDRTLRFVRDHG